MKRPGKRCLAMLLCIVMWVSLLPASALAEEGTIELAPEGVIAITEEPKAEDAALAEDAEEAIAEAIAAESLASGACGDDLIWEFTEDGVLTISGTGAMWDYSSTEFTFKDRGWNDYRDSILSVVIREGVTRIGGDAFSYCASLTSVTIPDTVTSIGDDAFFGCSSLAEISIPDNVTSVGEYLFFDCTSLTDVVLPNSLTTIAPDMFEFCEALTSIKIPDNVTSIGELAFNGCRALEEIFVGCELREIGHGAFCDCVKLDRVYHSCSDEDFQAELENMTVLDENDAFLIADYIHLHTLGEPVREIETYATTTSEGSYDEIICCAVCGAEVSRKKHTIPITTCRINPVEPAVPVGSTKKLEAKVKSGKTVPAEWRSDGDAATVNGNGVVTAKKVGKAVITAIVDDAMLTCDFRVQFKDVTDPSLFYYDPIYAMVDKGVIGGYKDGTFKPDSNCNRAAVVTFLWRLAGKPEPEEMATFSDMPTENEEFCKAISWAAEQEITTGYSDGTFHPWATCNRAAIVTFLWRYADKPEPSKMADFKDMTTNDDFNNAISWAAENGITTGWDDNTFRPWNTCNRLAVASFLNRYAG